MSERLVTNQGEINMLKSTHFSALNTQIENMFDTNVKLANTFIESFKQASAIQYDAVRSLVTESTQAAKNLCTATDASEAANLVKQFAATSFETSLTKSKEIYDVLAQSKQAFATAAADTLKDAQESLVRSVDQAFTANPALSKAASESIQNIITTSNQAADAVSKVSAQVVEVATKNIQTATNATLNTVKKATAKN